MINHFEDREARQLLRKKLRLSLRALDLLEKYLDLVDEALDDLPKQKKVLRLQYLGALGGRLIEIAKLTSRDDAEKLEPQIEEIFERVRRRMEEEEQSLPEPER
jgi:hypothetical protein